MRDGLSAGGRWIRTSSSWSQEGAALSVMGPFRRDFQRRWRKGRSLRNHSLSRADREVRIHLPPAESQAKSMRGAERGVPLCRITMRYSSTPPGSIVQSPSEQPTISHWQSLVSNESVQSHLPRACRSRHGIDLMVCGHRRNRCLADFRSAPCALNPARRSAEVRGMRDFWPYSRIPAIKVSCYQPETREDLIE